MWPTSSIGFPSGKSETEPPAPKGEPPMEVEPSAQAAPTYRSGGG